MTARIMTSCVFRAALAAAAAVALHFHSVMDGAAAGKLSADASEFLSVVRTNFASWNKSKDGHLTLVEIEAAMQNSKIKGPPAATLAALMWGAKPTKNEPKARSFALSDFDAMEQQLQEGKKLDRRFIANFTEGKRKIEVASRELFTDKIPHLDAIRQQLDSDCYFNSAIGSIANVSPERIVTLIKTDPDGSFTVSFPGKAPERIPAPTDAEIAAYTDASDGVWFNVLEKAYGRIRKIDPKNKTSEPVDAVALHGGGPTEVIKLLTGHNTEVILLPIKSHHLADEWLLKKLRIDVARAFADHRAVAAGKYSHVFAVVAYDRATDTFTLHNPYDRTGKEKMPDGQPQDSVEGFFTMTTQKLVANFNDVVIESPSHR